MEESSGFSYQQVATPAYPITKIYNNYHSTKIQFSKNCILIALPDPYLMDHRLIFLAEFSMQGACLFFILMRQCSHDLKESFYGMVTPFVYHPGVDNALYVQIHHIIPQFLFGFSGFILPIPDYASDCKEKHEHINKGPDNCYHGYKNNSLIITIIILSVCSSIRLSY